MNISEDKDKTKILNIKMEIRI